MKRKVIGVTIAIAVILYCYLFLFFGSTSQIAETPYKLTIQPGLTPQSVALVRNGLATADSFLLDKTGRTLQDPVKIKVAYMTPCSPLTPINWFAPTAQVVKNTMCINTLSGVWRQALREKPGLAYAVIAHEHYHLLQNELGGLPPPWKKEYDWIIEGSAAYVGWETAISAGHLERSWVDDLLNKALQKQHPTLASTEKEVQGDAQTAQAQKAVEVLIKRKSLSGFNTFYEKIKSNTPWKIAFKETFGISVDDFYKEFER